MKFLKVFLILFSLSALLAARPQFYQREKNPLENPRTHCVKEKLLHYLDASILTKAKEMDSALISLGQASSLSCEESSPMLEQRINMLKSLLTRPPQNPPRKKIDF